MKVLRKKLANYLPIGAGIDNYELIDVRANNYMYWGHKYSEGNEAHENNVVALQFQHSTDKPFWIVIFKGAGYRDADIESVNLFEELPDLSDTIEDNEIDLDDTELKGVIDLEVLTEAFRHHCFEEDKSSESLPLIYDDAYALEECANLIMNKTHLVVNLSLPLDEVTQSHIDELEVALEKAKQALKEK